MSNFGLEDYINELESFCKKRKIEYIREDRGIAIKNAVGDYNIHIYVNWENCWGGTKVIIGFVIGDNIYFNNSSRYESNLGLVGDMSVVKSYLQKTYPEWLSTYRNWNSRSKYR